MVRSPGWPEIKESFFNGAEFKASFPLILRKFVRNIFIFCVAEVLVLILALFIAVLRSLPGPVFTPLRILAAAYTDLFRGVPTILVDHPPGVWDARAQPARACPTPTTSGRSWR